MFSSRQVWRREATLFQKAYRTWVYNYRPSASLFCGEAVWYVRLRFLHSFIFGFIFILTDSFIPFVKDSVHLHPVVSCESLLILVVSVALCRILAIPLTVTSVLSLLTQACLYSCLNNFIIYAPRIPMYFFRNQRSSRRLILLFKCRLRYDTSRRHQVPPKRWCPRTRLIGRPEENALLCVIRDVALPPPLLPPKRLGREANYLPSSVAKLKMSGTIPPLPHIPSWGALRQPHFTILVSRVWQ